MTLPNFQNFFNPELMLDILGKMWNLGVVRKYCRWCRKKPLVNESDDCKVILSNVKRKVKLIQILLKSSLGILRRETMFLLNEKLITRDY